MRTTEDLEPEIFKMRIWQFQSSLEDCSNPCSNGSHKQSKWMLFHAILQNQSSHGRHRLLWAACVRPIRAFACTKFMLGHKNKILSNLQVFQKSCQWRNVKFRSSHMFPKLNGGNSTQRQFSTLHLRLRQLLPGAIRRNSQKTGKSQCCWFMSQLRCL